MLTIVDLYSGCGGLSLGAHAAGFDTILTVDIDPVLTHSIPLNFPSVPIHHLDLSRQTAAGFISRLVTQRPTGVIGGPPCQGFSIIGRRQKGDPRNNLLRAFFKCVAALSPKFFLMENVPGLLDPRYRRRLDGAIELISDRYVILEPFILDAADFGAATKRPRLLVIGYDPNEMSEISLDLLLKAKTPSVTVREAISDIPGPSDLEEWCAYPARKNLSQYASRMRKSPRSGYGRHVPGRVSGCQSTTHSGAVVKRFSRLEPGERDVISKFPRLHWDRPALVLRAGTGNDKGSYQAARPIHPKEPRVITVREAARLQGFPDWFQFHPTKWHSHRMIGNSVSPIFAEALLSQIAKALPPVSMLEAAE